MPERDCWPTPPQHDLLLAALADPERALAAWHRYQSLRTEPLEAGELGILPMVHWNLRRAGIADAEVSAARHQRRMTAVANEMLFRATAPVLTALLESGVATIVLKGSALVLRHYPEAGLRPMGDVDVLVRGEQAEQAIDALAALGYVARAPLTSRRRQLIHAEDFSDAAGRHIDLHWRLFPQRPDGGSGLWERSIEVEMGSARTRALSPADLLLHVIVHGLHWAPQSTLRWATDAAAILRSEHAVDWDVIIAEAERLAFVPAVRDGLAYLNDRLDVAVPSGVRARLAAAPVSRLASLEYSLGCRRSTYTVVGGLPVFAFQYARDARVRGRTPQPFGFLGYLAEYWAYDSVGDVLRRMVTRAALRTWSRVTRKPLPPPDPVR